MCPAWLLDTCKGCPCVVLLEWLCFKGLLKFGLSFGSSGKLSLRSAASRHDKEHLSEVKTRYRHVGVIGAASLLILGISNHLQYINKDTLGSQHVFMLSAPRLRHKCEVASRCSLHRCTRLHRRKAHRVCAMLQTPAC